MLNSLIHKTFQSPILQKIYTGALWKIYAVLEKLTSATESFVESFAQENCHGKSQVDYLSLWVRISRSIILNDHKELSGKTFQWFEVGLAH